MLTLNCQGFTQEQVEEYMSDSFVGLKVDSLSESQVLSRAALITPVFGAIHLSLWKSEIFPSTIERNLWRVTSLLTTLLPVSMYWILHLDILYSVGAMGYAPIPLALLLGLYGIVRLYLIIEPFIGLRSVPAGVFQEVQWTALIPHI